MEEQLDRSCKEPKDKCEYGERLKSLTVGHYRGFGVEQTIKFAHPNGKPGSGLTIVCGENNSGKSSILHALMKFHDGGPSNGGNLWYDYPIINRDEKDTTGDTRLSLITCDGGSSILEYSKVRKAPNTYEYHGYYRAYGCMFVKSDVTWASEGELQVEPDEHEQKRGIIGNEYGGHNAGFVILQDLYDKEIGNYLRALSGDKPRWRKFKHDLKYIIPEWKRIYVTGRTGGHYKIKVYGRNRQRYSADLLGGGYLRLLRIVVAFYSGQGSNSDLIIDEPELYLQPFAQKRLMKLLVRMSAQRQVILITHSPHFIDWRSISNGAVVVHTHVDSKTDENRLINLTATDLQNVLKLTKDWHKPQLLDAVAKELFFTRAAVFTEGQEDVALLNQFALEKGIDLNFDWFGYGTGGAPNIRKFLALAKLLSISAAAIYDGDQSKEYAKALNEYGKTAKIVLLSKEDIRDKYEVECRTCKRKQVKNGYFFEHGSVKRNATSYLTKLLKSLNAYFA